MARKKAALDFEQSLADLQTLVERLENGELSLEDSLTAFEQGIGLTRDCQAALAQAEQKVQVLLERDGELAEEPFDADQPERLQRIRRPARPASTQHWKPCSTRRARSSRVCTRPCATA